MEKINTYGEPLNEEFKEFDPTFDPTAKLSYADMRAILYWLNVHNNEVNMDEYDVAAFKKLMLMLNDDADIKRSKLYQINNYLNRL